MIKVFNLYLFSTILKMGIVHLVSPPHVMTRCSVLYTQQHC